MTTMMMISSSSSSSSTTRSRSRTSRRCWISSSTSTSSSSKMSFSFLVVIVLCLLVLFLTPAAPPSVVVFVAAMDPSDGPPNHNNKKQQSPTKRLTRKQRREALAAEAKAYTELRNKGISEVGDSIESKALRDYRLRKKKTIGLLHQRESDLTSILFPGVVPELYELKEDVYMITELVQSKKTHVPFDFYDLPGCGEPSSLMNFKRSRKRHQRRNLGVRLQGMDLKPAPYMMHILENQTCTPLCRVDIPPRSVKWLRKLVDLQYRVHLTFDQLPVLMRSDEYNYAVRGFPLGFIAPPEYTGRSQNEYYLYNHLTFTIRYYPVAADITPSSSSTTTTTTKREAATATTTASGIYITGFDVHPVSIVHSGNTCGGLDGGSSNKGGDEDGDEEEDAGPELGGVVNDPATYLPLRIGPTGEHMKAIFSYEVIWVQSDLEWADRWDIYLIGSPDDDIHFFAIVNSLMIVLFMTGAIATIMIRTLRKDISTYNEMSMVDDGGEDSGWKLCHGDVFRPPQANPLVLSVLVGTGAQIGTSSFITLTAAMLKLVNPIRKGQTLTAMVVVYVLSGSVSGYVSARIYKFCDGKNWKMNTLATATALPGLLVAIFTVLNIFLGIAGAASSVSFLTLLAIFALWTCVSAPLVFVGSFVGFRQVKLDVPTKTNQIARYIPDQPWFSKPPTSFMIGGILPFGSVCIELFFIMSALWLHQIYYVMGFLLAVLLILAATCAQVSIVMTYLQLCAEDHRWWWKSFANCASAGIYLFAYSLWFLFNRLDLVGALPVVVYLTYMSMVSLIFAIFCGSVGFLCSFSFIKTIYGALKVD